MTDKWIPRLYVLAQVALVIVTGVMIMLDKDSVVTDLFLVAGGGLVFTQGYRTIKEAVDKSSGA